MKKLPIIVGIFEYFAVIKSQIDHIGSNTFVSFRGKHLKFLKTNIGTFYGKGISIQVSLNVNSKVPKFNN